MGLSPHPYGSYNPCKCQCFLHSGSSVDKKFADLTSKVDMLLDILSAYLKSQSTPHSGEPIAT